VLVQFRVDNHRSLRDEQTLSLVGATPRECANLIIGPATVEPLLPAVALYGANASGKTNLLHAVAFARDAVLRSHRFWEPDSGVPQEAFAFSDKAEQPSLYELDIVVSNVRFRYGFVTSARQIEEEWLFAWPQGRKQLWFEREGAMMDFGKNLHGENETIRSLTRPNSLFLSAAAQNNHPALLPIFDWFRRTRVEVRRHSGPFGYRHNFTGRLARALDDRQPSLFPIEDRETTPRDTIVRMLRAADLGIRDIRVGEREPRDGRELGEPRRVQIQVRHDAVDDARSWLPLELESAGTITLLELAVPLIDALRSGGVMCIDELESSLHPMIALELVRLFNDPLQNRAGAQLVFTTHDTNLLGRVLGDPPLSRDQIWFTEKDRDGATHIYPLTDFHPRKEENLERGYLQGRYGAVPYIGELAKLFPSKE
jgi:hypothetical protein